ncbi:AAA family ATPase [Clostridium sp. KNHs205]|jgi:predicted ATPase|uniref:AAA family ATPase n=1 Tax=Clostridium sp. KNHs205 TaxID=1449050 RepID=UPI00051C82BB|nr:AAA family ATPase [Clostridium sp. KNHs205]
MQYLTGFSLPTQYDMDLYGLTSAYPFGVLYFKELNHISFDRITIFYGGNGSGKSTLLNLLSDKLELPRRTTVDRTKEFIDFTRKCSVSLNEEEGIKKIPSGSKIITSEDIIDGILAQRKVNKSTGIKQEQSYEEYNNLKYTPFQFTSIADFDRLKKVNQTRSKTATKYIKLNAGEKTREFSNGENALRFFDKELTPGNVYLLDEPENSLSPKYQYELTKLLFDLARFFDVQFVIATHSPFVLSLEGARIYNLDEEPVEIRRWEELESIRFYHDFFMKKDHLF